MRILILGASGGVGRWATRLAARDGHVVTALVRPETPFEPPAGVTMLRGSVLDRADLDRAIDGNDVLLSCIGPQRVNPRNPWSPLRQPLQVAELHARAIVDVCGSRVRRVAAISAAGVGESHAVTNGFMRWMLAHSTVGDMYRDLDAMERVFRANTIDWLAVRPVILVNASPSRRTHVLQRFRSSSIIGRADVAAWLLRAVTDSAPIVDRTPMIGWW